MYASWPLRVNTSFLWILHSDLPASGQRFSILDPFTWVVHPSFESMTNVAWESLGTAMHNLFILTIHRLKVGRNIALPHHFLASSWGLLPECWEALNANCFLISVVYMLEGSASLTAGPLLLVKWELCSWSSPPLFQTKQAWNPTEHKTEGYAKEYSNIGARPKPKHTWFFLANGALGFWQTTSGVLVRFLQYCGWFWWEQPTAERSVVPIPRAACMDRSIWWN